MDAEQQKSNDSIPHQDQSPYLYSQPGGIDSFDLTPELLKRLQIWAQRCEILKSCHESYCFGVFHLTTSNFPLLLIQ
jgi:hypothetical protein